MHFGIVCVPQRIGGSSGRLTPPSKGFVDVLLLCLFIDRSLAFLGPGSIMRLFIRGIILLVVALVVRNSSASDPDSVRAALAHFAARESSRFSDGRMSFDRDLRDVDWQQFENLKDLKGLKEICLQTASVTDADLIHLQGFVELVSLTLWETKVRGSGLKHLAALPNLRNLTIHPFDDEGLSSLQHLPGLKFLNLYGATATDDGLRQLGTLVGLESLDLMRTPITDAGLPHLASLRNLRTLSLDNNPAITNAALPSIARLKSLRSLSLIGTSVTDIGPLAVLPQLESLDLQGTNVTSDGLAELHRFHSLRVLRLAGNDVDAFALQFVSRTPQLEKLALCHSKVTDTALPHLAGLKTLKVLELWNTKVTDTGIVSLQNVTALEELDLMGTGLGDAGMAALATLPRLKVLNASRTSISDGSLPSILKMTALEEFDPIDTELSQKGTEELRRLRPSLSIAVDAPP